MGKVLTGVTLETLSTAIQEAQVKPGQSFTIIIHDAPTDDEAREEAFRRFDELSKVVSARFARAGIQTEEEIEAFLENLDDAP